MTTDDMLLEVRGLKKHFPIRTGLMRRVTGMVKAVDGINFHIRKGETLGLVGESGCGKKHCRPGYFAIARTYRW